MDKILCDKVKFIRKNLSKNTVTGKPLSQAAFAESLGIPQSNIAEIETYKREPSKNLIKKILEVYGINIIEDNSHSKENTSDLQILTYQLRETQLENQHLHKEVERLKKENIRLITELERIKNRV